MTTPAANIAVAEAGRYATDSLDSQPVFGACILVCPSAPGGSGCHVGPMSVCAA